jgi:hypothetical protein
MLRFKSATRRALENDLDTYPFLIPLKHIKAGYCIAGCTGRLYFLSIFGLAVGQVVGLGKAS